MIYPNKVLSGNIEGGSITVPLTSCLTGLDKYVLQIKTKIVSCHTADFKPVNQEVNCTVILIPFVEKNEHNLESGIACLGFQG
jgi:hypothetical protein